jgi:hypothetical protein
MATPSRYEEQGFYLYRKSDTFDIPVITYSQFDGACYEDDGYDDVDAMSVVEMLKHQIDQGQGIYFREISGLAKASGELPVSQETHDKWLNAPIPFEYSYEEKPKKKKEPAVNVNRVTPKVVAPPPPKRYTAEEDDTAVEKWIVWIEQTENMQVLRTPQSVRNIAKWIRQDESVRWRYMYPISCADVKRILKEFEK